VHIRTPDTARLAALAEAEGARVRQRGLRVTIIGLPVSRIAELTAEEHIAVHALRPESSFGWVRGAVCDLHTWRARVYFVVKLPVAAADLLVAAGLRLAGLFYLTYPIWWELAKADPWLPRDGHIVTLAGSFLPLGAVLVLAAPWLTHAITDADRTLIRSLLGPDSPDSTALAGRVRDLEKTRAHAVEDSAARLRRIERDLHDGEQAQLVALAMKLGLAKEKLGGDATPVDLARVAQLVDDAQRSAIEAITELRTLARGIHPSVLDNGLADALTTLAARSAVPVELITDIPERPSAAIETIAYFSAAVVTVELPSHA
jgi:signal transduction histidine kinase